MVRIPIGGVLIIGDIMNSGSWSFRDTLQSMIIAGWIALPLILYFWSWTE